MFLKHPLALIGLSAFLVLKITSQERGQTETEE